MEKIIAKVQSYALQGIHVIPIHIEVDVSPGLPNFIIVGLPDAAVSEAKDRVRTAIKYSGFTFPRHRVTVNLAPAHIRKVGALFDLPIAIGILIASGEIHVEEAVPSMIGELNLSGAVRAVPGCLPIIVFSERKKEPCIIPQEQENECTIGVAEMTFVAKKLLDVVAYLQGEKKLPVVKKEEGIQIQNSETDMKDIVGQHYAKRACEIAAAGGHNILFSGPPGVGKSMLARALHGIMPELTHDEWLEAQMIHSLLSERKTIRDIPFRSPHHSASAVSVLGGGNNLRPGEISLAHHGILFLDEIPEFRRDLLEALRQPLEDREITITRATGTVTYPAAFQLVATANPCPCGYYETQRKRKYCSCSPLQIQSYQKKISGPLLDRIDMKIRLADVDPKEVIQGAKKQGESSKKIRERTQEARTQQQKRQKKTNASMSAKELQQLADIDPIAQKILEQALEQEFLSMRGYTKTIRVSRTIADLDNSKKILQQHMTEALSFTSSF